MRSAFAVLTAAAFLTVPALALAGDDDDRDGYHDGHRDRHHDRDRDCDNDWDCDHHDDYDHGDWDHGDYHHDDYDHGDNDCPRSFDFVVADDNDHRGNGDRFVCCKVVGHGWKKAVLCIDPDDDHGYHDGYDHN